MSRKNRSNQRFDRLLQMMATQPEPLETPVKDSQTSRKASGASYGDTRTRAGKIEGASSRRADYGASAFKFKRAEAQV